jgi:hypothetical protein
MAKRTVKDAATKQIERALAEQYLPNHPRASLTVYRYNSASIRVRVVDPDFEGQDLVERETEIFPIIRKLPDDLQDQITMLFLVTPHESERSTLSAEFDHPTPSRLW